MLFLENLAYDGEDPGMNRDFRVATPHGEGFEGKTTQMETLRLAITVVFDRLAYEQIYVIVGGAHLFLRHQNPGIYTDITE